MPRSNDVLSGRYELKETIAAGGMSTVWRARDQVLARTVAVKVLHDHLARDEAFLTRFRREAVAAAGLTHPHVVSIYDTGEMDQPGTECHYIVMEHCGGGTLHDLLKTTGPMDPRQVAAIGATVCDALAYAHDRDIVHRDVKPANILVGDDGLMKVGDFGIAKAVSEKHDLTTTGKIMGTVAYISPEYASDEELDARSDIYSLGVVLYELATGRPPFMEETSIATAMKHMNDPVPPVRSRRAGIPRALEHAIMKALEKAPADRFASATAMGDALRQVGAAPGPVHGRPPSTPATQVQTPSSFRAESRWIGPVIALIVAAVVLAAAAAALIEEPEPTDADAGPDARSALAEIEVAQPSDFDPEGDGTEDTTGLADVVDGDPATTWKTDTYQTALNVLKSGVGILFDLGEPTDVGRIEVTTPDDDLDLEILAGDALPDSADVLEVVGEQEAAGGVVTFETDTTARYWVVWITDLPGGGPGSGSIAEVSFFGR